MFLWVLENYFKSSGNISLGESADVEAVLVVDIEYDEVSEAAGC